MHGAHPRWAVLALAALPVLWVVRAGGRAMAPFSTGTCGHIWVYWNGSHGDPTFAPGLHWPDGIDLVPNVGGWTDIVLGSLLSTVLPLTLSFNLVIGVYALVAGFGGFALARVLGARYGSAIVAGLLFQLDGYLLHHLWWGHVEQVGIGFPALAVAGAIHTWRRPGWWAVVGTGLAGALTVITSWQLGIILMVTMLLFAPFLVIARPPRGAWPRWLVAAGVTVVAVAPVALLFISHAGGGEARFEPHFDREVGSSNMGGMGWLGTWIAPGTGRAAWTTLLCLLALPWVARRQDRRAWLGLGAAVVFAGLMAAGPYPGWFGPAEGPAGPQGVYAVLLATPIGRFLAWPDRWVFIASIAAIPAAALVIDRLTAIRGWLGPVAAVVLLGGAMAETVGAGRVPEPSFALHSPPAVRALGALPDDGALIDVPLTTLANAGILYQNLQITHGRPILVAMSVHDAGAEERLERRIAADPFLAWLARASEGRPTEFVVTPQALSQVQHDGFRYLALHRRGMKPPAWQAVRRVLERDIGPAVLATPDEKWLCWDLGSPPAGR